MSTLSPELKRDERFPRSIEFSARDATGERIER